MPASKNAERHDQHTPNQPTGKRDDNFDVYAREGQPTADELADAPREYAVDRIVRHIGKRYNVMYFTRWYSYTPASDKVNPLEHIPEHFTTPHWRRMQKNDAV